MRNNLEAINGTIGGLLSFITGLIAMILGSYQEHNYENQLVSKLYTTRDLKEKNKVETQDLESIPTERNLDDSGLAQRLSNRIPISLSFMDRILTRSCCLPFKRCISKDRY